MDHIEHVDEKGRKYKALRDGDLVILLGPPEGLVDELDLPEPFATNLHNALYARGLLTISDVTKKTQAIFGALQEALSIDQQKVMECFYRFEHEEVHHE